MIQTGFHYDKGINSQNQVFTFLEFNIASEYKNSEASSGSKKLIKLLKNCQSNIS